MYKACVKFGSVLDAKKFVNVCSGVDFRVDLASDRYTVDAKSIMGLLSLDLSKVIEVHAYCDEDNDFVKQIQAYIV